MGIRDVARAAGVSTTTVSHALSGKGRLPEETRERVRAVAERMGYRPSPIARSLAAGRVGVLGVAVSVPEEIQAAFSDIDYFSRAIAGATGAAMRKGYALVIVPALAGPEIWARLPLDGAILVEPAADDPNLPEIRAQGLRLVTIGRAPGPSSDDDAGWCVDNDNVAATREVLDHLEATGCRHPALVTLTWDTAYAREAVGAYREWCEDHGRPPVVMELGDDEARWRLLDELLERGVDGVFALYEQLGIDLIEAAAARRMAIPADLRVVAGSDLGAAETTHPPLSEVDFRPEELGAAAAELLIELVEGGEPPDRMRAVPAKLIARASSAGR